MKTSRREFLRRASAAGAGAVVANALPLGVAGDTLAGAVGKPIVIASANGMRAVEKAMEMIKGGADGLDAAIAGVNIVEDDPEDTSVGYGGLPNEDGVVELDAAVMAGRLHTGGSVAALRNIKNPSKVARVVMERSDHVLLVGEGALRFAKAHGFKEEDLLTDKAREIWLRWKESRKRENDWLPPHTGEDKEVGSLVGPYATHYGTIHCSAIDQKGNLSCVTTTSGRAFKIPGRVGDSAIIGDGLFLDNAVGSAGSTGRGEANQLNCSCAMIVESMRRGKSPEQACLEACQRVADHTRVRYLQDDKGRPNFDLNFYAVSRQGEVGGAGIRSGAQMAVHDGTQARLIPCAYLYKKE